MPVGGASNSSIESPRTGVSNPTIDMGLSQPRVESESTGPGMKSHLPARPVPTLARTAESTRNPVPWFGRVASSSLHRSPVAVPRRNKISSRWRARGRGFRITRFWVCWGAEQWGSSTAPARSALTAMSPSKWSWQARALPKCSLRRFHVEAEAVARLQHVHIVQIFAIGDYEGLPYMVLELVEGETLAQR